MSRFEEMSSYITDPGRYAVCGEMASIIGNGNSDTKDKLAFESKELALSKAKNVGVESEQVAYLCQFCQYWHLGKNVRIGAESRTFLLPYKKDYKVRKEIKLDRPLYLAIEKLKIAQFVPAAIDEFKMDKIVSRNKLKSLNVHRLGAFTVSPEDRAIVWALHLPSLGQPLVLKANKNFVFRSRAGDYWGDDIEV